MKGQTLDFVPFTLGVWSAVFVFGFLSGVSPMALFLFKQCVSNVRHVPAICLVPWGGTSSVALRTRPADAPTRRKINPAQDLDGKLNKFSAARLF